MNTKLIITVPKPCKENWNSMSPDETGRFCNVCIKSVVDFTKMKSAEIQNYFIKNKDVNVCGRFKKDQLDSFDITIPKSVLNQQMSFQKAFLLILFIVMGTTLFSCKNDEGFPLGEVAVVEDTIEKQNITLGMVMPPKDSILKYKYVDGKVKTEIITDSVKAKNK
ncbi:hypothetical protein [Flavobacterium sp.]|uniref:hypothetical protein n=1 Tax=Flavobacterium sp. TaxID=239 RepID=UPI003752499D